MKLCRAAVLAAAALLASVTTAAAGVDSQIGLTALAASEVVPGSVNRTSLAITASYDARVWLNYGTGRVTVISYMSIRNRSGGPIDRLELNSTIARVGGLRLGRFEVDGKVVTAQVVDQTIKVPLGGVLPSGGSARVRVGLHATLRTSVSGSNWMFTRYNGTINAYRWLPWISRATPFDRPNYGDPFVTTVSPSVRLTITTDRTMKIATSGRRIAASGLTQTFEAANVRDFNFAASPFYQTLSGTVGATKVTVFYRSGAAGSAMLSRARTALSSLTALAGPYPYPTFNVAQSAGGYAMESPALIWIPPVDSSRLAYLITHETAHQWFYSIVGNDQAREPFADEAMADLLTRYSLSSFRSSACSGTRLDRTIYVYSYTCYYEQIYVRGSNVMNQVRMKMGNSAFWSAVKSYVATYSGRISRTAWLLQYLDDRTSVDLRPIYRIYFPSIYP